MTTDTPVQNISRFSNGKVSFFLMSNNYNNFLRGIAPKINSNVKNGKTRPSVAVGLLLNGHKYVIPLTSQYDSDWNKQTTVKIKDGEDIISCLKINNMHPVSEEHLIYLEFDKQEAQYKGLLEKEHQYIKNNIEEVITKAVKAHKKVYKGKDRFFINLCCDFKALENQYKNYDPTITYPTPPTL